MTYHSESVHPDVCPEDTDLLLSATAPGSWARYWGRALCPSWLLQRHRFWPGFCLEPYLNQHGFGSRSSRIAPPLYDIWLDDNGHLPIAIMDYFYPFSSTSLVFTGSSPSAHVSNFKAAHGLALPFVYFSTLWFCQALYLRLVLHPVALILRISTNPSREFTASII